MHQASEAILFEVKTRRSGQVLLGCRATDVCSVPGPVRGGKHRIQTGRGDGVVKPGFNLHQAGGFDGVNQAGLQGAKALGEQAAQGGCFAHLLSLLRVLGYPLCVPIKRPVCNKLFSTEKLVLYYFYQCL